MGKIRERIVESSLLAFTCAATSSFTGCSQPADIKVFDLSKQGVQGPAPAATPPADVPPLVEVNPVVPAPIVPSPVVPAPIVPSPVVPSPIPSTTPIVPSTNAQETFPLFSPQAVRKIDLVFVVDNSGSMADEQAALAGGMDQIAQVYFYDRRLDICPAIITSDRYATRSGRERLTACSSPPGSETWSDGQHKAHIDALRADFKSKVNVGIGGSGYELLGKSLAAFVFDQEKWDINALPDGSKVNPYFRKDGRAVYSFLTDENNLTTNVEAALNDLPAFKGSKFLGDTKVDQRVGIRDYLDIVHNKVNGAGAPTYSVASFLALTFDANNKPVLDPSPAVGSGLGGAKNLFELVGAVLRDSVYAKVTATANDYAAAYSKIMAATIAKFDTFTLAHDPIAGSVEVILVRGGVDYMVLQPGTHYSMSGRKGTYAQSFIDNLVVDGDKIRVEYKHL